MPANSEQSKRSYETRRIKYGNDWQANIGSLGGQRSKKGKRYLGEKVVNGKTYWMYFDKVTKKEVKYEAGW